MRERKKKKKKNKKKKKWKKKNKKKKNKKNKKKKNKKKKKRLMPCTSKCNFWLGANGPCLRNLLVAGHTGQQVRHARWHWLRGLAVHGRVGRVVCAPCRRCCAREAAQQRG